MSSKTQTVTTVPFKREKAEKHIISKEKMKEGDIAIYQTASGLWRKFGNLNAEKVQSANNDPDYYKSISKIKL